MHKDTILPPEAAAARRWFRAPALRVMIAPVGMLALAVLLFSAGADPMPASAATAGRAASGELLFYPCDTCHQGAAGITSPNGFEGHGIALESHDMLGDGVSACVACHDDPVGDPARLKVAGGGFVEIGGADASRVCYQCHSARYAEWEAGIHGRNQPGCMAAGCHDPHTPAWIYGEPLMPFVGTGFQVRAVSDRRPFTPLASYPVKPPVYTPEWLWVATALVAGASAGVIGYLIRGRRVR